MNAHSISLGHFRLIEPIGKGGMGHVWRGVHVRQDVPVAIKVLTAQRAKRDSLGTALRNEVRAVARLHHHNIIMLFDHGLIDDRAAAASDGRLDVGSPYLAMELVNGGVLDVSNGPVPWANVRRTLLAILNALAHAHARGVIHRDLKPGNVLIPRERRRGIKLTDFGIARALDRGEAGALGHDRRERRISGTLRYMAPEQIAGSWRDEGPWTDLYALGTIAYRLATGELPYGDAVGEELMHCHLQVPAPPVEADHVPDGFSAWLDRMLAKRPANRFERAADAAWALLKLPTNAAAETPPRGTRRVAMQPTARFARWADAEGSSLPSPPAPEDSRPEPRPGDSERWTTDALEGARPDRPPTPRSYERPIAPPRSMRLVGAGLGLYGLRPVPMVGRVQERSILWSALRDVSTRGDARVIALVGAAGCGKSRIAEWIGQRAHEVGAATVMHAIHSPITGPGDGLAAAIERELACVGLDRDRVIARCARHVEEHPLPDDTDEDPLAIAELIAAGTTDAGVRLATPADRFRVMRRLLERMSTRRPVILWIDDVQWGSEALGFAEFVLASDRAAQLPLLVIITARDAELAVRPEGAQLDAVLDHSAAGRVDVAPLPPDEHARLVELLLGLSGDLSEEVAERTHGNPLFAVQLIGDWVARGVLSVGESGFVVRSDASVDIPDDIHELWSDRVDAIIDALPEDDRAASIHALEIAAALGQRVVLAEWEAACRQADVEIPGDLVEHLLAQRMAVPFDGDWSFAHGMLRESLERRARDAGRWPAHHRACATMLADRHADERERERVASRLGRHLVIAGDLAAALEPLFAGAEQHRQAADFRRAQTMYDELERAMTDLALPADDQRWGVLWTRRARACISQGMLDRAASLAAAAASRAAICGWPAIAGWAAALHGHVAFARGEPDASLARFEAAVEQFRSAGDQRGLAEALTGVGRAAMWQRVLEPANTAYQEAYELHRQSGDMYELGMVLRGLAGLRHCENDLSEARVLLERASACFEHSGNRLEIANCLNDLGELARAGGDLSEAEDLYRRAGRLYDSLGCTDASTPHFNLGLVLLERGDYAQARERFEEERDLLGHEQKSIDMLWLEAGLLACAAADHAWDEFDELLEAVESLLKGFVDEDIAWCTTRASELAADAGERARARAAQRIARNQWVLLDRADQVARLDES